MAKTVLVLKFANEYWMYDWGAEPFPEIVHLLFLGEDECAPCLEIDQRAGGVAYLDLRPLDDRTVYVRMRPYSCAPCDRDAFLAALLAYRWKKILKTNLPQNLFDGFARSSARPKAVV